MLCNHASRNDILFTNDIASNLHESRAGGGRGSTLFVGIIRSGSKQRQWILLPFDTNCHESRSQECFFEVPLPIQYFPFENYGIETIVSRNWITVFVPGKKIYFRWDRLPIENASIKYLQNAEDHVMATSKVLSIRF
jgi:hypothetical protein